MGGERQGQEMEKHFSTDRGLEVTIFCPAGADMHGRPDLLWRASWEALSTSPGPGIHAPLMPLTESNVHAAQKLVSENGLG